LLRRPSLYQSCSDIEEEKNEKEKKKKEKNEEEEAYEVGRPL